MNRVINTTNAVNKSESLEIEYKLVTQCPKCSIASEGHVVSAYYSEPINNSERDYLLYYCPHCSSCYFVTYRKSFTSTREDVVSVFPSYKGKSVFPEEIELISPKFIEIYNQALIAENSNLTALSGIGYRKALEFLVKDYCIYNHKDLDNKISEMPLAKCISTYIDNPKIKATATASAWIGNDETHYVKKHIDYNVMHLKSFIRSLIGYIEIESSCSEAMNFIYKD